MAIDRLARDEVNHCYFMGGCGKGTGFGKTNSMFMLIAWLSGRWGA